MKCDDLSTTKSVSRKTPVGAIAGLMVLSAVWGGTVWGGTASADPSQDAVAKLNELTKQAQQMIENVQSAQLDLDTKLRLQSEAEKRHADDLVALDAARAQLAMHQTAVDRIASAVYMGGTTDDVKAMLTSASPQSLIDKLSVQRLMASDAAAQMQTFHRAEAEARAVAADSAKSAADAKAAADAAAALRADLQKKESELQSQVAQVKVQYGLLSPAQQALLGPGAAVPTVGMSGLVPDAKALAAYIIATYPGVQSIGGVRPDPIPDHPSGHAIDIMIGSDMALGDAINADVQSQSGRFNVRYTMWRVPSHFNHVHVTVD